MTTLHKNDIIDIVSFDETATKRVRRVKVRSLADNGDGTLAVVGVNMHAENPMSYTLPLHPFTGDIVRKANTAHWRPFVDRGEGEE
jgi:hypothetical protein